MEIKVENLRAGAVPLYREYPGRLAPQPAYVQMDEDGRVEADYSGEIGNGVPMFVWHGRTLRWTVSPNALGSDLADLIESDEVKALLTRVYEGHSVDWDGNNHVGRLTEDAEKASEQLTEIFAPESGKYAMVSVWTAYDWIVDDFSLAELVTFHFCH